MPAGKWDLRQPLSDGYVVYPAGPINLAPGETLVRIEAWVMQQRTQAAQMTYHSYPPNTTATRWKADKVWYPKAPTPTPTPTPPPPPTFPARGPFRSGPALGTAIAIGMLNGQLTYYWWTQEVELY